MEIIFGTNHSAVFGDTDAAMQLDKERKTWCLITIITTASLLQN